MCRIFINRYSGIGTHTETPELHCFADSSNQAYGVVVCLHSKLHSDVKVSFVFGKSRLAPTKEKSLTIPKLEPHTGSTYSGTNKREASQRSKCSSQQIIFLE